MERGVTEKASHYKKGSLRGITKKDLRVHRRSLDWKQQRDGELNRRRNCDDMSPVVEESATSHNSSRQTDPSSTPKRLTRRVGNPQNTVTPLRQKQQSRSLQLKKWKEERDLKKKLDAKLKKPVFKVTAIKHEQAPTVESKTRKDNDQAKSSLKPLQQTANMAKAVSPGKATQRTTRSSAAKAAETAPKPSTKSATVTRSTRSARNTQPVKDPVVKPEGRTTRSRANIAPTNKPATQTRNRAAASKKPKAGEAKQQTPTENQSESSVAMAIPDPMPAAASDQVFQFNAEMVTMDHRKEHEISCDFSFIAPANLTSFVFPCRSPNSAARFLDDAASLLPDPDPRRCSTPKLSVSRKKQFERTTLETSTEETEETIDSEPVRENTDKKNSFTRQNRSRRSIRVQRADKLTTVGEESQDIEECIDTNNVNETSQTTSEEKEEDAALPLETLIKTTDELMAACDVEKNSQSKDYVTDNATESEVTKTGNDETSGAENCQESAANQQDDLSQQQAPDRVVENLKTSSQRRRSTRRSLRLQSLQTETEQKVPETEQVIEAEEKITAFEVTEEEHTVTEEKKVMETKQLAEIQEKVIVNEQVTETEPAVTQAEVSENSKPVVDNCSDQTDTSEADAVIEVNNTESTLQQTTPVSAPRGRSRARRSLVKSITSEEAEPSEEVPTKKEESGNPSAVLPLSDAMKTPRPVTRLARKSMSAVEGFARPSPTLTVRQSGKKSARKQRSKSGGRHSSGIEIDPKWIKTLESSPMIELTRRKLKTPPEKLAIDFDDWEGIDLNPVPGEKDEVFSASDSFIQLTGSAPVTGSADAANQGLHVLDANQENSVPLMKSLDDTVENVAPATMPNDTETTTATCDNEKNVPLDSESIVAEGKHDVKYFRDLVGSERSRLNDQCSTWEVINEAEEKLTEEVKGQIRTTVGQAQLLMDQRFKQFIGLVDNCEFKTGEKETTCSDLQGFWDMIYYQVEDVDRKFEDLKKLKAANWVKEQDDKPTKLKTKKKIAPKATRSKPVAKSNFAAFRRAQMKKNKEKENGHSCEQTDAEPAIKVFDAGFFKVSSPQKTPSPHCALGGTPSKILFNSSSPVQEKSESSRTVEERKSPAVILNSSSAPVLPAFLNRTPRRRSYVPSVPSPLLCDITPSRAKKRRSLRQTPVPNKLRKRREGSTGRSDEGEKEEKVVSPVKKRRHSRSNSKCVSFSEGLVSSEPTSPSSTIAEIPQSPGDLSKLYEFTLPTIVSEDKSEDDPEKRPKSALKGSKTPRSGTRKSVRLSVHFDGPSEGKEKCGKMPQTPVNRNSRVACTRVRSAGFDYSCWDDDETDLFKDSPVHNTDKENQSPTKVLFVTDNSLIASPLGTNNRKSLLKEDLISFTP